MGPECTLPPQRINKNLISCPFSSVVERATRNGEVGCSIQPVGSFFLLDATPSARMITALH